MTDHPTSQHPTSASPDLRVGRVPWITILVLLACAIPVGLVDELAAMAAGVIDMPSDVDQELRAFQQFGQFGVLLLVGVIVWQLEPPAIRRTLLDLGLAALVTVLIANTIKTVVGRVRPAFGSPDEFYGWFTTAETTMSWSQCASMPSSHTAAAAVLAAWMAIVQPRLRWLGIGLTVVVGIARIRFGNHWPSDVLVGAALGSFIGSLVVGRLLGTRLLDLIWRCVVDRQAGPAAPEVAAAIRERAVSVGQRRQG